MKSSTHRYDEIINMKYPYAPSKMAIMDRAKIFAPFAALKGFEEAIEKRQRIVVPRIELSDEAKDVLDMQLLEIERLLSNGEHPIISVVYFSNTEAKDKGEYLSFTGMAVRLDVDLKRIQIVDKRIPLEDIYNIVLE